MDKKVPMKKHIKLFEAFGNKKNPFDDTSVTLGDSPLKKLKNIKSVSVKDLTGGVGLVWIMKKIILNQEERIDELEYKIAELMGEVEPE